MPRKIKKQEAAESQFSNQALESVEKPAKSVIKLERAYNPRILKKRLADIYAEAAVENSARPAPTSRNVKILSWSLAIMAFLAGVSWLGFFLFGRNLKFSEDQIRLVVEGPAQAVAGSEITYRVYYGNNTAAPLGKAVLSVRLPDNFQLKEVKPKATGSDGRSWELGTMEVGRDGMVEISGRLAGAAGNELTARAFLDYIPAGVSSEFQKIASLTTVLSGWPMDFVLSGPEEVTVGGETEFILNLKNQGEKDLPGFRVVLSPPLSFKLLSSAPSLGKENNVWVFPSGLAVQASTTVKIKGLFTAEVLPGAQSFGAWLELNEGEVRHRQNQVEKIVQVVKSDLVLDLAANGSIEKQGIFLGDKVQFAVSYANAGNVSLKNVTLRLVVEAPSLDGKSLFDWSKLEDGHDGAVSGEQRSAQLRRGVITWTKAQWPNLGEIKPNATGTLEIILPVKNKDDLAAVKLSDFKSLVYAEAVGTKAADKSVVSVQSNNLNLVLNSDINLALLASFKQSNDLLSLVGQQYVSKQIYQVVWTITNSLHELTDLKLTATLPENVDWEEEVAVSAGEISFDKTTKQVSWQLNRLPTNFDKAAIGFSVGLKQTAADLDAPSEQILIEKTRLEAKDKVTGENILRWQDAVTTLPR